MPWTSLRLELARTAEFPQGSSRHIYLLHLPLGAGGLIDEAQLKDSPERATVHRYWGDEPSRAGYVVDTPAGWAISYERGEDDDEPLFHLETHRLQAGDYVTIVDSDGERLPMRIVSAVALVDAGRTPAVPPPAL